MTNLNTLASRVEDASGPDRQIDCDIAEATGWTLIKRQQVGGPMGTTPGKTPWCRVPKFTASLDAALTLIPDGMGDEIEITTLYRVARVGINLNHGPEGSPFYGENKSNSIPHAIIAASLRALSAMEDTK